MLTLLTNHILRWIRRHRQRAALRRMLQMNDRMLEDIGLRRTEIEAVLGDPLDRETWPMAEARRLSRLSLALDRCI